MAGNAFEGEGAAACGALWVPAEDLVTAGILAYELSLIGGGDDTLAEAWAGGGRPSEAVGAGLAAPEATPGSGIANFAPGGGDDTLEMEGIFA